MISGFAALTCRANVRAKPRALPFQRLLQAKIVEPGFADGNDLRVIGQRQKPIDRRLFGVLRVGMHADRGDDVGVLLRDSEHCRKLGQSRANVQCRDDFAVAHSLQHARQVLRELGKRQMAVRIDMDISRRRPPAGFPEFYKRVRRASGFQRAAERVFDALTGIQPGLVGWKVHSDAGRSCCRRRQD